jgi:DNA-binding SARP family transcriptional activator
MDLNVKLLGGFEVSQSAGLSVAFRTRKARALFALLARRPGRRQAREALAAMFWPDSAEPEARRNLRQALKLVRRALADSGEAMIVSDGDALVLAPAGVAVDVELFERFHEAGTPDALERAAALYRGDFLDGMTLADGPFQDWSTIERVRLRERAADVFARLLDHRLDGGGTEPAIHMALRLLALDPLPEPVHRRLMQLYLDLGRRGSALEQYRVCRDTLEHELGVPPEPETDALYQAILRGRARVEPSLSDPGSAAKPAAPSPSPDPFLSRPAVAVLPFANLSGDPVQAYFSDGLSEDIITALAGWRCFPLIASRSTLAYRDERHDVRAIARSLDAHYVVDGSIRRVGGKLRISVQLVESEGGRHLWAERFDLDLRDILALQDEAALKIAAVVEPELERAEVHRIVAKRSQDLSAWDHCLQGTSFLHRYTPDGNALARSSFQQALRFDAGYSDAFTGFAFSHLREIRAVAPGDRGALIAKGLDAARRAVALDATSSMAHLAFAEAHVWAEDFDVAIPETQLAIELNPSNAIARMGLGNRLDLIDRTAEGIAEMERGLQLNPRDPWRFNYMGFLARAHISLGDYQTALGWASQAVQLRPDLPDMHFRLAICLGHLDRAEEARAALQACERLRGGYLESRKTWQPYGDAARNEHFFAGLRRHNLIA